MNLDLICDQMGEAEMGSGLKQKLKSLCCSNGWSYGVFWRFDKRNSMLLTFEDAYYEEQMGAMVDELLLQVHMMGEGVIGQVAFTGKHRWMFSDAQGGEWNSAGSIGSRDIFQDDSALFRQFSSGIKTIAVISVESQGVVQFGSTQKILERLEFFDQTKRLFWEMENADGLISLESPFSSLNSEDYDLNGLFDSLVSSGNSYNKNLTSMHGGSSKEFMGKPCFSTNVTQSSKETTMFSDSFHLYNQLQTVGTKAQVQQGFFQSTSSVNNSAANTPCISEGSILTQFEPPFPPERGIRDSPNVFSTKANTPASCRNTMQNSQGESTITSMYSTGGLVGMEKSIRDSSEKSMNSQHSTPLIHATEGEFPETATCLNGFFEEFEQADFATEVSNSYTLDNLSHWFTPSPEHSINRMESTMTENLSQSMTVTSVLSGLIGGDVLVDIPEPSSITNNFIFDCQEKPAIVHGAEKDLFEGLGLDFVCAQTEECLQDLVMPVMSGGHSDISTGMSEYISKLDMGSMAGPQKRLFSQFGLEEPLDGITNSSSITESSFEDRLSTTRRSTENSSCYSNQVQLATLSCASDTTNLAQHSYNLDKTRNLVSKKEVLPKSQVGLWINDSYSINAGNAVAATPKKPEEPMKATKKRARPGESTRPRPKDRQQIQDRIQELRGIVPCSGKSSIDILLDRTIKYMLFLQSVTKYADKLKQSVEPKLIGQENGLRLRDSSTDGGGATWAFEVGDQSMVCPIIVEDFGPPGQMLIEMLCEEQGFFLEIADVIRSFGLNILKGVMEIRENKIWAHFIVEANTHVTRIDIFCSLIQLLQQNGTSGIDSMKRHNNFMDCGIPALNNYQQPLLPHPISMAETLQ